MARICFLFNHDQTHQLAHSLPIALELIARGQHAITIAVSSAAIATEVRRLGGAMLDKAAIVHLSPDSIAARLSAATLDKIVPARKLLLYRDNVDFFRGFDALVVPDKSALLLKTRYGLTDLKLIHTRHGAGDRAIGFNRESALFDLIFVAGPKIARRLVDDAGVDPARIATVGYAKFDLCRDNRAVLPFTDPALPAVLYNPHPSPKLSSWFSMGPMLLDVFAHQRRYNLIFAPHVMLFTRRWTVTIEPPAVARVPQPSSKAVHASNILIDRGSPASSDMRYTNSADVYIGDVSSQVYEFLIRPRPCVFLNAHGVDWRNDPNYLHWQAGEVIGPGDNIVAAVDRAIARHADYLPMQQAMIADTFSLTDQPSASRAADAIDRLWTTSR